MDKTEIQINLLRQRIAELELEAKKHQKKIEEIKNILAGNINVKEKFEIEQEPVKDCILSKLVVEVYGYGDRLGSWEECSFLPYTIDGKIVSFDTPEEAQEYVYKNANKFSTKVYCHNTATGKITKLKKVKK